MVGVGELQRLMTGERIGRPVPLRVYRSGDVVEIPVTPTELAT